MATQAGSAFPAGQRWDASILLGLGVLWLVLRLPLGILVVGITSVLVIALQGVTWRRGFGLPTCLFVVFILTSGLATLANLGALLTGYLMWALCFGALAVAAWFSGSVPRNLTVLLKAVYVGLWVHFLVSVGELVSGIKILPLRDPTAGTVPTVLSDPWVVTSLFVNYNDYSVAMVIFVDLLAANVLFARGRPKLGVAVELGAAVVASGMIVVIGSRGALLALVVTLVLLAVLAIRGARPEMVTQRRLTGVFVAGAAIFAVAWNSPYFQNHSTQWRETIIQQIGSMIISSPIRLVFGYGSQATFDEAAKAAFPGELMNPHNLLVEIVIAYGVFGCLAYLAVLGWMLVQGFLRGMVPSNSIGFAALLTTLGLVVYGAVPSSYLDYGYAYLFIITGAGALWVKRALLGSSTDVLRDSVSAQAVPAPTT